MAREVSSVSPLCFRCWPPLLCFPGFRVPLNSRRCVVLVFPVDSKLCAGPAWPSAVLAAARRSALRALCAHAASAGACVLCAAEDPAVFSELSAYANGTLAKNFDHLYFVHNQTRRVSLSLATPPPPLPRPPRALDDDHYSAPPPCLSLKTAFPRTNSSEFLAPSARTKSMGPTPHREAPPPPPPMPAAAAWPSTRGQTALGGLRRRRGPARTFAPAARLP
jgi:hypothetical protein